LRVIRERFSLDGKTALVTGASRGIGRAIALGFAEHGADLILSSRKREGLEEVAKEVQALGRNATVIPANVSQEESIDALVGEIEARGLPVDVLVNNAATNPVMAPLVELESRAWGKVLDTNLTGPFLLCRALGPGMAERGSGAIVNIASNGGISPSPGLGAYAVSKAALIHLTRCLAVELGPRGVRVNAIAPGLVETHFAAALFEGPGYQAFLQRNPLGRHAQPEEVAGAALLLASDAGSYANGEVIVLDGGSTL
jgi:NAD(P)-dependent dehydrogenase (short-subunit alcohol dehydrogenase family)